MSVRKLATPENAYKGVVVALLSALSGSTLLGPSKEDFAALRADVAEVKRTVAEMDKKLAVLEDRERRRNTMGQQ